MEIDYNLIKEFVYKFKDKQTSIVAQRIGEILLIEVSYCGYEDGSDIKYQIKILNNKYEVARFETSYSCECGYYEDEDLKYFIDINGLMDYLSEELS